ncbi:GrpB family protein [Pectobacterium polaris]|uniref:GrpB family protein n=1 Tax=Pectobacterium polaris TaxID=2042057 RepID=UPI00202D4945|nr:GrpB family protein [Pectobacterium polaris]MCL6326552.1 GrpB family protein [Pectobacterium polaris]
MRQLTIVSYDELWLGLFEAESVLLQITLGQVISRIHHVGSTAVRQYGSTAVPGLAAKPVIDILLEVVDLNALDELNAAMEYAGYTVRGENGIQNRRYFTKGGEQRTHHIHAFAVGDTQIVKHLAFRDYLIKNTKAAKRYAEIKCAAVRESENDTHRYSALKTDFIKHHLRLALMGLEE